MSLYTVQATLILDNKGRRLLAQYYNPPASAQKASSLASAPESEQKAFEKRLSQKTSGENADVLLLDNHLVLYKQCADIIIYLVADLDENEDLIYQTLLTLRDSISSMLGHQVDRATALSHYDRVALVVDEVIDNGVILTSDKFTVLDRTTTQATEEPNLQNIDLSENGFATMFSFAKGKLAQAVKQQLG